MLRIILLTALALYLITVGLWPPTAAPVSLLLTGLAAVVGLVPGPVWLLTAGVAWLKHQRTPNPQTV
ncbi:hypothetical protein [Streptomyces sp. SID8499]|uniref:hypothetical protein n=1 Tax=Streptomyces sp. SID8499 TaxID=2706106 RepID=UPI0013CAFE95|nr:hypothetical protein [Streptomyces sp. SID8499]NED31066.1 hypothetical protein [Streptomyces sp. SID8499]